MTITISPDAEKRLRERAQAEGMSIEAYVEQLIREDEEWDEVSEAPLAQHDPEFGEVQAAVTEGLDQAKRGEGRPAQDVFAGLRAKHGISR
jgi:predicted transcriptional regulator